MVFSNADGFWPNGDGAPYADDYTPGAGNFIPKADGLS